MSALRASRKSTFGTSAKKASQPPHEPSGKPSASCQVLGTALATGRPGSASNAIGLPRPI